MERQGKSAILINLSSIKSERCEGNGGGKVNLKTGTSGRRMQCPNNCLGFPQIESKKKMLEFSFTCWLPVEDYHLGEYYYIFFYYLLVY